MVRNWPAIEHSLFVEWLSFQKKREQKFAWSIIHRITVNTIQSKDAGKLLDSISKAVGWAGSMTWKGIKPLVHVLEKVYETGVSLTKKELKHYLSKLKRSLTLNKWYICINSING